MLSKNFVFLTACVSLDAVIVKTFKKNVKFISRQHSPLLKTIYIYICDIVPVSIAKAETRP